MIKLRQHLSAGYHQLRLIMSDRPAARAWLWSRLGAPEGCFHIAYNTTTDRYPAVFEELARQLRGRDACRILSFGCSRGLEVFSLAQYLPGAEIKGIDINASSIAYAQRHWADAGRNRRLSFRVAASTAPEPPASLDAILAMTVFCAGRLRLERPECCSGILSFAAFAAEIACFAEALKPGGLLMVGNANFRVEDTAAASRFRLIRRFDAAELQGLPRPVYGPDERLISGLADPGAPARPGSRRIARQLPKQLVTAYCNGISVGVSVLTPDNALLP